MKRAQKLAPQRQPSQNASLKSLTCHVQNVAARSSRDLADVVKFYGCANYPKCDFISNYEPVAQKCDECGGDMIKKELKKGTFIECTKCKKKTLISES